MKNIDKIKLMNSEELAELLASDCHYCIYPDGYCQAGMECTEAIKIWLEKEAENEELS